MVISGHSGGGVKAGTTVIRKVTSESLMSIYPRLLSPSGFLSSKSFPKTPFVSATQKLNSNSSPDPVPSQGGDHFALPSLTFL